MIDSKANIYKAVRIFISKMASKNITLKVDENLYHSYKAHCKKKGLIISRQFELFVEQELKNRGKDNE